MKKNKKKTLKETIRDSGVHKFGFSDSVLPKIVQKWAGLKTNDGQFTQEDRIVTALTDMNDFGGSFKKIATFIEKNWENL